MAPTILDQGSLSWAQSNMNRDELPIDVKARLDGEYVQRMSFWFDMKCILGTVLSVIKADGVVEGVTVASGPNDKRNVPVEEIGSR